MPIDIGTALVGAGQNIAEGILTNEERKRRAKLDAEQLAIQREQVETAKGNAQRLLEESKARLALDTDKQGMAMLDAYGGQAVPSAAMSNLSPQLRALATQSLGSRIGNTAIGGFASLPGQEQAGALTETQQGTPGVSQEMMQIRESEPTRLRQAIQQANIRAATAGQAEQGRNNRAGDQNATALDIANLRGDFATQVANIGANARMATAPPVQIIMPDGSRQYSTPANAAGQAAPPPTGASAGNEKIITAGMELEKYVKNIQNALKLGKETGWSGTGVIEGRLKGVAGGALASASDIQLRGLISDIFAKNAHERFGGALTPSEIERARGYLAEATDSPQKLRTDLSRMLIELKPAFDRWTARKGALMGTGASTGGADFDYDPATGSLVPIKK